MTIGFLGLGEVGTSYSTGLASEGVSVKGYDVLMSMPAHTDRFKKCSDGGVKLVSSPKYLVEGSDYIIAVTTSHVAIDTAKMVQPYVRSGQIYIELNSAWSQVKEEVRKILGATDVVDGATMGSPLVHKHKTLIFISGEKGKQVVDTLNSYGMNLRFVGDKFGTASNLKIVRSDFTKPMEACFVECMTMAKKLGIEKEIFSSICDMFNSAPIEKTLSAMLRSNPIHAKRRGEEVSVAIDILKDFGLDNTMTVAGANKLLAIGNSGMKEDFKGNVPEEIDTVLEAFLQKNICP
jgi:3-hydroxyisobutyrate dehydrogenase-like beta-hydroxyacid dehydrogenase